MMFGVKIVITGDKPPKRENAIIIMNHRCRLDWMFYWSVVARHGELKHEKIIMKHELKHVPGPGKCCDGLVLLELKLGIWPTFVFKAITVNTYTLWHTQSKFWFH